MARLPLVIPPGVFNNGTQYQSKGRWFLTYLARWYGAALGPVGGWRRKGVATLTGLARAAVTWRDGNNTWIGIGTHSKLYVSNRLGGVFDITPVGFTVGRADAVASGGYGSGPYGTGTYGTPRPDTTTTIRDATQWTLDTWGAYLLGVSPDDRKIYQWVSPTTGTPAAKVTNSPDCDAVVTTEDRFVFALGTDLGTDDPRAFTWCDQEDNTNWGPPGPTNAVGSYALQTAGRLMCGERVNGGTLLHSTVDAWLIRKTNDEFVHSRDKVGEGCGIISRQGAATFGTGQAVWMSLDLQFWLWNGGAVVPLQCDVLDYIRTDINKIQASKIWLGPNSGNSEIEVHYCSGSSTEIDRCVFWDYKNSYWGIGRAPRTCGVDRSDTLPYPVQVSSDGKLYDHEYANTYDGDMPYATSGPIELGNGDNIMWVMGLYPDDANVGDVDVTFTVRRNQDDVGVTYGPYSLSQKTDFRFSGGIVEITVAGVNFTSWRVGIFKLEVKQGEGRG